ncbi:hypothetical protein LINGRAHAP2_LOCUS26971 [Linum grandiflorum]
MPHGRRMRQIRESGIPYPHRAGNIYKIQYLHVPVPMRGRSC